MFCSECGLKTDGANFCPDCGSAINGTHPVSKQNDVFSNGESQEQPEKSYNIVSWSLVVLVFLLAAAFYYWQQSQIENNQTTATSEIVAEKPVEEMAPEEAAPAEETFTFDREDAENYVRSTLYESTSVFFLTGCPENLTGSNGAVFTCEACPQDYVALDGAGWLTLGGEGPWRCDAAGGGWFVDLEVLSGDLFINTESIRNVN